MTSRITGVLVFAACAPDGDYGAAEVEAPYTGAFAALAPVWQGWKAEPDSYDAQFGISVSSAGDVNGDGFDDVIIGASEYENGTSNEGGAFVYFGSAFGLELAAVWATESDNYYAYYGEGVASAGDVNGDGFDDVVVGAPEFTGDLAAGDFTDEGRVSLFLGSALGLDTVAAWTAESEQYDAELGHSVASAGDVNGDGFDDVVVGANFYDNVEVNEGRAFLYLGSPAGLQALPAWTAESNQATAYFGWSVASAGDVNGDGYDDVIVGAYLYDDPESSEGRAYLYLGAASGLEATAAWTAGGNQVSAYFGWSVASAGDVNGDGYDDVIVGAPQYDMGEIDEGTAYVFHGSATGLAATPSWGAGSDEQDAEFGHHVSSAGDVNADGYDDVVVGARYAEDGSTSEGRVYLYLGSSSGLSTILAWSVEAEQSSANLGWSVASAGDVDGDGYGDLIAGAPYYDNGDTDEGRVYAYMGRCFDISADTDADGIGDGCDVCLGDDLTGDVDVDGVCASNADGSIGDCNDGDAAIHPGAAELCDGVDGDCDEVIPDDEADIDRDGVSACNGDCDDADFLAFPGAPELCDGLDNACNGAVPTDELDADADLFMTCEGDCDDNESRVGPTFVEACGDSLDNDCDGTADNDCARREPDSTDVPAEPAGCGCAGVGQTTGGVLPAAVLALLALRRRRHLTT